MADAAVTVIGAGVVGLATAAELAAHYAPVLLLERYPKVGQETSSRNSEVIHAGLYYPYGSLKAELCIEGKHLLYELAERHGIPHRRVTKLITAATTAELEALERLYRHGRNNGVELELITADAAHALEPHIASAGAIFSPTTGIISAHGLMDYFHHTAIERGAVVQTRCEVTGIARVSGGYALTIREGGEVSTFITELLVNAAGLESDTIAALAGIDVDAADYRLHWCKGSYFALNGALRHLVGRLVYPVPPRESLGVHALMDLAGRVRFGPDVEYLPDRTLAYAVEEAKRPAFAESVRHILPMVKDEDLTPDMSGIRPKLQRRGEPVRDYIIAEESGRGLPGFINLIGIESPGLTASPAIARRVLSLSRSL